jgi:hypothetical protein
MAIHPTPTSNRIRGANRMGRHNPLSGGDPRQTTDLVPSHQTGWQTNCWVLSLTGGVNSPSGTECCCTISLFDPWWTTSAQSGDPQTSHMSEGSSCYNPSVSALLRVPLGTSVTGRFTRIWVSRSSPTTSELWPRVSTQGYLTWGTSWVRQLGRHLRWFTNF